MYIVVEGNIGAGKTTLALALSEALQASILLEEFDKNLHLESFYTNTNKLIAQNITLNTELQFLNDRNKQLKTHFENHTTQHTVSDYLIIKSLMFAKMNLTSNNYQKYKAAYDALNINIPKPDLVIFLSRKTTELLKNIKKRGRSFEKNITPAYLEKIAKSYQETLTTLDKKTEVLELLDKELDQTPENIVKKILLPKIIKYL